jgi:hypothetical protein
LCQNLRARSVQKVKNRYTKTRFHFARFSRGRLKNVKIDFWITKQSTKNGQQKIKMIIIDLLIRGQLFGKDDSKVVFESTLESFNDF